MSNKIVIAISQSNQPPWIEIRKTQQKTWIREFEKDTLIIHYSSKTAHFILKIIDIFLERYRFSPKFGRIISVISRIISIFVSSNIPEYTYSEEKKELFVNSFSTYLLFGRRNLALYDWFLKNTDANFLFQTNTSSFIRVDKILELIDQLDSSRDIYAGVIINSESDSYPIVSGAGKLLSRSLILKVLENRDQLNFNNLEDVCLSELVFSLGVVASNLPRVDIPSVEHLRSIKVKDLCNNFHFRCKSIETPRTDDDIMKQLEIRISQECHKSDNSDI